MEKETFKLYEIPKIQAPNFIMSPVEFKNFLKFKAERIYFISQPTAATGSHCHKIEEEFFIMMQGSCTAVIDRGYGLEEYKIQAPQSALYVGSYVWHHFKDFSSDAIFLAISSTNYNPTRSDYVENYDEFKKLYDGNKRARVLILGADGTLGQYIRDIFKKDDRYEVVASTEQTIDFTDEKNLRSVITDLNPSVIINCAAYNNVDDMEDDAGQESMAYVLNQKAVEVIADIANSLDSVFVHYSTDYVFSGEEKDGYVENSLPNPINKYGKSKMAGELSAEKAKKHYLIRTSRLFGKKGANPSSKRSFIDTLLELSATKDHFDLVNEEVSSPTYAKDLAERTKLLIDEKREFGIYHVTNQGSCGWYDFGKEIFSQVGKNCTVTPVAGSAFPRPARRPAFTVLRTTKLDPLRTWQEALRDYLKDIS